MHQELPYNILSSNQGNSERNIWHTKQKHNFAKKLKLHPSSQHNRITYGVESPRIENAFEKRESLNFDREKS